jgi:O-Antigen ligase
MKNKLLILLSFLMALVGGGGVYAVAPVLMNILYLMGFLVFLWFQMKLYQQYGLDAITFNFNKFLVFFVYLTYLIFYILLETVIDTGIIYDSFQGVMRSYTNLIRGLIGFIIVGLIYRSVNQHKIFSIMPVICLSIVLTGMFLEAFRMLELNADVVAVEDSYTTQDLLLLRPGGFMNANMSAAVALIWLYVALESKFNTPTILKLLALMLTLTICLLTQSRAALLFASFYVIYKVVVLKKINYVVSIIFVSFSLMVIDNFFAFDFLGSLIEKFSSRTDSKETSALERLQIIDFSMNSFFDSPFIGNGILYVAKTGGHGNSSHNQILETLSSYGLIGFFIVAVVYVHFYHRNYFPYVVLCILPTLLFSHNFFETIGFQVALAFAYNTTIKTQST